MVFRGALKVYSEYKIKAFYDKTLKELFYVSQGFGPDGSLEKLKIENGKLRSYAIYNDEWEIGDLYYRKNK